MPWVPPHLARTTNPKLVNIYKQLYKGSGKPHSFDDGSTASATTFEATTGGVVHRDHHLKSQELYGALMQVATGTDVAAPGMGRKKTAEWRKHYEKFAGQVANDPRFRTLPEAAQRKQAKQLLARRRNQKKQAHVTDDERLEALYHAKALEGPLRIRSALGRWLGTEAAGTGRLSVKEALAWINTGMVPPVTRSEKMLRELGKLKDDRGIWAKDKKVIPRLVSAATVAHDRARGGGGPTRPALTVRPPLLPPPDVRKK